MTNRPWRAGASRRRRALATASAAALLSLVLACNRADGAAGEVVIDAGGAGTAPAVAGAAATAAGGEAPTTAGDAGAAAQPEGPPAAPTPTAAGPLDPFDAALDYARCIRANGYPDWPDPNPDGGFTMLRSAGMSFNDPRRTQAMDACQAVRPPGMGTPGGAADPETTELLLELARCMRANGVVDFPDPAPGGGAFLIGPNQGIDANSPTFRNALAVCGTLMGPGGRLR